MGPSCLNKEVAPLVIDASVIINLNASLASRIVLHSIPNSVVVTDVVIDELRGAPSSSRNDLRLLIDLINDGLIAEVAIDDLKQDHFEQLVLGDDADTLDDGEAATIAYAVERGAIPVIDERKALRICRSRYPSLIVASTIDLFALDKVVRDVGRQRLSDAVLNALIGARMRVLPQHLEWVLRVIGKRSSAPMHEFAGARP
jgi:predicted nucleic acid-binding protein